MSSALIASHYYLVPVKPEPLSATGIDLLHAVVDRAKTNYALSLSCIGVVLTMAESHTIVYAQAKDFISKNALWKDKLFRAEMPKRTAVAREQGDQRLILDIGDSDLNLALTGITRELLSRIDEDG
jgi:chromosome partitioning protein